MSLEKEINEKETQGQELPKDNSLNIINKKVQSLENKSITLAKELIKNLLQNYLDKSLSKLEQKSKTHLNTLQSTTKNINNFRETINIFINQVEENIKKNKKHKKLQSSQSSRNFRNEYNFKTITNKSNITKFKKKNLKLNSDISNKTISNFKTLNNSKIMGEKDKKNHKFKNFANNTQQNFRKKNKIDKKIENEKISFKNSFIKESNKTIENKGIKNKLKKEDSKEFDSEKKLNRSQTFKLKFSSNFNKNINLNKLKINNSKKDIKGMLYKKNKKEIKLDKELYEIREKDEKRVNTEITKKIFTRKISKNKDIKNNKQIKDIKKPEDRLKEQEKTIQNQKEKILKLSEELEDYKNKLKLKEKDTRNGIFIVRQNKTIIISNNSIKIEDEIVITIKAEPLQYSDSYFFLIDYEVDKLKSRETYIEDNKVDDSKFEISNNKYKKIEFERIYNGQTKKIKVIYEFSNEFSNYSYYSFILREIDVLSNIMIKGSEDIQIDDVTNKNFKISKGQNYVYFEGKTTNEIIVNSCFVIFSRKVNYQIYNYIPEFKNQETDIINNKEKNNEITLNILARYKEVIFTNYGQDIEDIYKFKISNYPSKMFLSNLKYPLLLDTKFEIDLVELNGQKVEYSVENSSIIINNFGAFNNQFGEVHFKYKYLEKNEEEVFRQEYVITSDIKNSYCKLIIKIPDNYVVVGTNDIFQKSLTNNNEYIFKGISKEEKLKEFIKFSNKKGKWDIQKEITLEAKENIVKCKFEVNRIFKGGNLKEESYELFKDNAEFIDDLKNDKYIFNYNNLNIKNTTIGCKLKVINSTTDYIFDGNEELIIKIPKEDEEFFKNLSNKILKEDKSNFPNYKKLGKWVYNYMTYNLSYTGRKMTAKEIYNKKIGVCEHFTLLYNTLLVSQGIKVVKVSGYAFNYNEKNKIINIKESDNKKDNNPNILKDNRHCWTLALIDGTWVPLDATWNLFEKNVPISHIYENYGNGFYLTTSYSGNTVNNEISKEIIKYTEI